MFVAATNTIKLESDGGGEHLDPRLDEVLVTTDAQPAGRYLCRITIAAFSLDDSRAVLVVQHRDADDNETPIEQAIVVVPNDDSRQFDFAFALDINERVSVVPYADMIGTVTAAINWQRIS